jgi:hypothetical protein
MGMLVIGKDWGVFQYKKKQHDLGKDKNPRGKTWISLLFTRH